MNQVTPMNQAQPQIAPSNLEAEQALLGAILINNDAFDRVSKFLLPVHFFEVLHQHIFKVISDRRELGKVVDLKTIKSFLPEHDKVGKITVTMYLARLVSNATTILNARDYGEGVYEMFLRREAISMADEISEIAYNMPANENAMELICEFEDRLSDLKSQSIGDDIPTGVSYFGEQFLQNTSAAFEKKEIKGVALPLKELEYVLSEKVLEVENLYGIISGSGEGKTSLVVQMIVSALENDSPVLVLSYDQSPNQFMQQIMAQQLGIDAAVQRRGDFTEDQYEKIHAYTQKLRKTAFQVVSCNNQTASQLATVARNFIKWCGKKFPDWKGVPLVVLDHIQRVKVLDAKVDHGAQHRQITSVCKATAKELKLAWVALLQRNAQGAGRKNSRPYDGDIFGGPTAKIDYDYIIFLYRKETYLRMQLSIADPSLTSHAIAERDRLNLALEGCKEQAEIGLLKARYGDITRHREVRFIPQFTKYESLEEEQQPLPGQELF